MLKYADWVAPSGMVTVAGGTAMFASDEASETTAPPTGAGASSVMRLFEIVAPPATFTLLTENVKTFATWIVALAARFGKATLVAVTVTV
jgi:hypothetical protein